MKTAFFALSVYVFRVVLRIKADHCHKQHQAVGVCKGDGVFLCEVGTEVLIRWASCYKLYVTLVCLFVLTS